MAVSTAVTDALSKMDSITADNLALAEGTRKFDQSNMIITTTTKQVNVFTEGYKKGLDAIRGG